MSDLIPLNPDSTVFVSEEIDARMEPHERAAWARAAESAKAFSRALGYANRIRELLAEAVAQVDALERATAIAIAEAQSITADREAPLS